jgi:hypothetical protein
VTQLCPGIASVVFNYQTPDSQTAVNVFHASSFTTDPWTHGDLALLAAAYKTWWETGDGAGSTYRARQSNAVTLVNIVATDLGVDGGAQAIATVGEDGQETHEIMPNGVTIAVSSRTGHVGKSFRGRTFYVGLTDFSLASGSENAVSDDFITETEAAFDSMQTTVNDYGGSASAEAVVLSRRHNKAARPTGVGFTITSWHVVDKWCDYQRRRAPAHNRPRHHT